MKNYFFIKKIIIIYLLLFSASFSNEANYFNKGKILFDKKNYEQSKILFQRDIVFNPKSERSYLYLAKIFDQEDDTSEVEVNLNSVLLLNIENEEALYMLTLLKIEQSDYLEAENLIKKFSLFCKTLCSKKSEMKDKFEKLIPDNAKSNN